ncbi:recombination-associated protein RdgC [Zooshikella ganghwensis]|uniref:Recombination-associated protein RdgC n=3 Tax=Zooshikella ganghwensis TaxID=202772 RepID=A0A4P9VQ24_9GAMM|nr:recombination-associated protein RdgC [Zooshikella ganghwensis]RDH44637.1 recombination-associated protein RdgC [Zooshikella ganghwensis]
MWFKNAIFFRCEQVAKLDQALLNEKLSAQAFKPCTPQQAESYGWVRPFGEEAEHFAEHIGNFQLLCLQKEKKMLPNSVISKYVKERIKTLEKEQGEPIGKGEKDQIKESVIHELLPKAFSEYHSWYVYLDPINNLIVVDSSNVKLAEECIHYLRITLGSLATQPVVTEYKPYEVLTCWLDRRAQLPEGLLLDQCAELRFVGSEGADIVKLSKSDLELEEVEPHIAAGKMVTKLGFHWTDYLAGIIHDDFRFTQLKFELTDLEKAEDFMSQARADFILMANALSQLYRNFTKYFGGYKKDREAA